MTILADIAKLLLDDHRGHYLAGVDRGILRAKSGRPLERLGADEIEMLTDIITEVIHKEWARAVADEQADCEFQRHAEDCARTHSTKDLEAKLARHKGLEDEAKQLKAALRATENTQAELVAAARAKIDAIEARRVIVERLHRQLVLIYEAYLRADQRACLAALENLHAKYAVTAAEIEQRREAATARLKGFLGELGYV